MSLKLFLPLFVALYNFGQVTFDLLFRQTLHEALESWIAFDLGVFDAVFDSVFRVVINAFPDLMNLTPILFLLTSGITFLIIINCIKFIIGLIP